MMAESGRTSGVVVNFNPILPLDVSFRVKVSGPPIEASNRSGRIRNRNRNSDGTLVSARATWKLNSSSEAADPGSLGKCINLKCYIRITLKGKAKFAKTYGFFYFVLFTKKIERKDVYVEQNKTM